LCLGEVESTVRLMSGAANPRIPELAEIPAQERNGTVERLLDLCEQLAEQVGMQAELIQQLKDEIARLKGEQGRPQIKPSSLEKGQAQSGAGERSAGGGGKRAGSEKRQKTQELEVHETLVIAPPDIPAGSVFKGYQEYVVQGIRLRLHNTKFRLERWQTPTGEYLLGQLPEGILGSHFDPHLKAYILEHAYQQHVTQPLLVEHLRQIGVDISSGQLNRLLTEGHERFHREKADMLRAGLEVSSYLNADDTGARHRGQNWYSTHIGNEFFAWFETTRSKSRINFLELLRAGHTDYVINAEALRYMHQLDLPKTQLALFAEEGTFGTAALWVAYLQKIGLSTERHIKIATEGALFGSILSQGVSPDLVILSDDAGQFNILGLLHALCWIHAERTIHKLTPFSQAKRAAQEVVRKHIWDYYQELKAFKLAPSPEQKRELQERFEAIFTQKTCYHTLNLALKRLHANKAELLLVLERPEIPLHNNVSENDIRDFVKKRKISASTRSELGRRCRDTFLSLKKTSRKLGLSFRDFLHDRLSKTNTIAPLPDLIRLAALGP